MLTFYSFWTVGIFWYGGGRFWDGSAQPDHKQTVWFLSSKSLHWWWACSYDCKIVFGSHEDLTCLIFILLRGCFWRWPFSKVWCDRLVTLKCCDLKILAMLCFCLLLTRISRNVLWAFYKATIWNIMNSFWYIHLDCAFPKMFLLMFSF